MTTKTAQSIYDEMVAHIEKEGGDASTWYAGITGNIEHRLFSDHNVPKKDHWYIYRAASSAQSARSVESALIRYGCDGGSGGGDEDSVCVYAYKKTGATVE